MKEPITIIYGIKWKCEGHLQATDIDEPKFEQLDKLLCKTFIAMVLKENPWLGLIIEKAESFYDEMKITDTAHFLKAVTKNYL
jgi:hypothetical protein